MYQYVTVILLESIRDTPVTLSIRAQLSVFYDGPRGVSDGIIARHPKPLRWRIKEFISRPPRWGWGKKIG